MPPYFFLRSVMLSISSTLVGAFIFFKPEKCIALEIAFYRYINWEVRPISMEREIRSTRWMGGSVLLSGALTLIYTQRGHKV